MAKQTPPPRDVFSIDNNVVGSRRRQNGRTFLRQVFGRWLCGKDSPRRQLEDFFGARLILHRVNFCATFRRRHQGKSVGNLSCECALR